jgi:hypothetical protein
MRPYQEIQGQLLFVQGYSLWRWKSYSQTSRVSGLSPNSSEIILLGVDNYIVGPADWKSVEVASKVSPCIESLWTGWVKIKKLPMS